MNAALQAHERLAYVLPRRVYDARPMTPDRQRPRTNTYLGRVLTAAEKYPGSFRVTDIMRDTGLPYNKAQSICAHLTVYGWIRRLNAVSPNNPGIYEVIK
jgi:hypothetical protein